MYRKGMKRAAGLALAVMLLAGAPAAAAESQGGSLGFLVRAWQWVQAVWSEDLDKGLCIDPDGAPCAAGASLDTGPHIDPDGEPLTNGDDGWCIDPNG